MARFCVHRRMVFSRSNGLVEIIGEDHRAELETQVSDQEEQGNTDGPPLGSLVVDVNIGKE